MMAEFALELSISPTNEFEVIHSENKWFTKCQCMPGAALSSGVVSNFSLLEKTRIFL
jgi:hypothetical protein